MLQLFHILSLVLLLPVINYRRGHGIGENPGQGLFTGVNDTSNNLSPVTTTPVNSLSPVSTTPAKNTICEYLGEFSKKFEISLMGYSEAWGKLIHEKKLKSKVSCQIPFNGNCTYLLSLN